MNIQTPPVPMQPYPMGLAGSSSDASDDAPGSTSGGSRHWVDSGSGNLALGAWIYKPANLNPDAPTLVAIHGISRRAKQQIKLFADAAERTGQTIIAPLFGRRRWAHYQRINNKCRSDLALLGLLAQIEMQGIANTDKFDLFGYSGGAQFSHRFAMLYPRRINRLSIAAAGWYCMPDSNTAYPYGLAARPESTSKWGAHMLAGLDAYLRLPINIIIGVDDNISDKALRREPALDTAQGVNRLERARAYHAALSGLAHERALRSRISLTELPGCGHSFSQCIKTGGLDRLVLG